MTESVPRRGRTEFSGVGQSCGCRLRKRDGLRLGLEAEENQKYIYLLIFHENQKAAKGFRDRKGGDAYEA